MIVDIADLDCIFLTYDEPKKEEFWIRIQNMVPWATRVDGVKGSDSAHKAAAAASSTERFVLIDRSEERRVGKECLRLCRSRWSPYH